MVICADTSFLFSLYGNDAHTPRAVTRMKRQRVPLTLTTLNEFELGNALRFAEFRNGSAEGEFRIYWAQFEADRNSHRLITRICNLADVVDEGKRISASYTLSGGHRGFDILHVAGAIVMKAKIFLTFDAKQKELAEAEGLEAPL